MNRSDTSGNPTIKASTTNKLSSTGLSSPVLILTPTSTEEPEPDDSVLMEAELSKAAGEAINSTAQDTHSSTPPSEEGRDKDAKASLTDTKSKSKSGKKSVQKTKSEDKKGKGAEKKKLKEDSTSKSELSDESHSDDESSEGERMKRKKKVRVTARRAAGKRAKSKAKEKAKKRKGRKVESSDESESGDSESNNNSESESKDEKVKRKTEAESKDKTKAKRKSKKYESSSEESSSSSSWSSSSENDSEAEKKKHKKAKAKAKLAKQKNKKSKAVVSDSSASSTDTEADSTAATETSSTTSTEDTNLATARNTAIMAQLQVAQAAQSTKFQSDLTALAKLLEGSTTVAAANARTQTKKNALKFKRVDQVWDSKIRDYKYIESVEDVKDEFDCVFTVCRKFGWDNKYLETMIDIKSKVLRGVLQVVFKDCKSVSLVEDRPSIHPHFLFHYYGEIKTYVMKTLKSQLRKAKKRKEKRAVEQQIRQGQLMLKYIDEDYEETREQLKPMLKAGTITYDLVWALFKPNNIFYTTTYGNKDDPRCFKVDYCYEQEDWMTGGKDWMIEGRYLEYDGKVFGFGEHFVSIHQFRGSKKISNLSAYPFKFHKEPKKLQEQLIERGKKFVSMQGMNYVRQDGLGYLKRKNTVVKHNINGRVMVDPAIFRRLHPNYPMSYIKQASQLSDELGQDNDDEEDGAEEERPKMRTVMWRDKSGRRRFIRVPKDDDTEDITAQKLDVVANEEDETKHIFSEEELLVASPVVLGFSFSEKLWLEFSLSGMSEIKWQTEAFEALVLPAHIKQNLKSLVSSHRFNAAKTIDDIIVGKGKGLNVVLHGPPGVGKTLTGESIAEFLRCPLYMVSSGELGTNATQLEHDLDRIMEITHAWGAILLLDEADVFLEARQPHDIYRNALFSVFLRLTEYYQGILFLTTNRVATFDEAFQSRIHMGIRYEQLTVQARQKIWMHYVGKVQAMDVGEGKTRAFTDADFDKLSRKVMNGRQIKNAVKTSQSIAIAEKGIFGMDYVKRVLESQERFEEDMMGGCGYRDAMRHYT